MSDVADAVHDLIAAFTTRNVDTFARILADDVVVDHVTLGRKIEGKEAVVAWFTNMQEMTEADHIEIKRLCEDGSTVWAERIDRHRVDGEWHEIPVMGIIEMNAGHQLTLMRDYFDPGLAL
ncbi:limonene-1,2-epoxide hydrolase family protein [Frankia sp. Cas3]|uniref:limonene-1,2-epoxide hydrolase family protein n=1 Tax=Frankia sp. Cas3 TaxID=3073926 RepID=UPI002AD1DC94|nr:limonene-1,2-epoxide hydrolase family protein [Frankia sp. Cas3]